MKSVIAGVLVAATMTLAIPAPASAIGFHVGPRGVGINVGHRRGYGYRGYRRPLVARPRLHRGDRRF